MAKSITLEKVREQMDSAIECYVDIGSNIVKKYEWADMVSKRRLLDENENRYRTAIHFLSMLDDRLEGEYEKYKTELDKYTEAFLDQIGWNKK